MITVAVREASPSRITVEIPGRRQGNPSLVSISVVKGKTMSDASAAPSTPPARLQSADSFRISPPSIDREVPSKRSTANSRFLSAAIIAKAISRITSASAHIAAMRKRTVSNILLLFLFFVQYLFDLPFKASRGKAAA